MGLTKTFGCYTVWTGACLSVVELLLSFCAALGFGLEKFWVGLAIAVVAVVFLFVELYGLSAQKFGIIVAIGIFRFLAALTSLVGKKSFGSPKKNGNIQLLYTHLPEIARFSDFKALVMFKM